MKKTKGLFALLAILLCLAQFVACIPEGNTPAQTTPEQTTDPEDTTPDQGDQTTAPDSSQDDTTQPEEQGNVACKPSIQFDKTLQIGNDGAVVTASGLTYRVSGQKGASNGTFQINQGLKVTLGETFADEFNRITLCFVSSAPLNCTVTYKQNGKTVQDVFYLEAGTQTFCALTKGYLAGQMATELSEITFDTCEENNADFALCDVKTEVYEVYADDVYYIQNDFYKLGVRLSWGGGICYLKDLKNKIGGIDNLINQADTGRLVQQSYYGTYSNDEYVEGDYNGTPWPYNPVQGGDVHGNASRIIDIVVGEHSLYIKAQPQDWGHDGKLTISYMENIYVLEENYVRVDNRFVDFSGWVHRYASQELPAFYTLSYFGEFSCYTGSKPWQDQPLTTAKNLNFWGEAEYHDDCTFRMRFSNTETWCAWTNGTRNYGIGLYTPNVDTFLAGRHAYDGSKKAEDGATNYVAPLCTLKLVSFEPIEYSYLMTTGSLEQIRSTFKANKDFATNESLHKNYISDRIEDEGAKTSMDTLTFDNLAACQKLKPTNNATVSFSEQEKAAALTVVAASDPHVSIDYSNSNPILNAQDYTTIKITYMIPTTNKMTQYNTDLFLCTGTTMNAEGGKSVRTQIIADGQYHTVEVKVSDLAFWSGKINLIRFDFFDGCSEGDVLYVRSIEFK